MADGADRASASASRRCRTCSTSRSTGRSRSAACPSRRRGRRIFTCRPKAASEERACAAQIIRSLASQAYRRPVDRPGLRAPDEFYQERRDRRRFRERHPHGARRRSWPARTSSSGSRKRRHACEPGDPYRISDVDLASRLSYFLWGTVPDATLVARPWKGSSRRRRGSQQQVTRMLADPRSEALSTRFASQWLRLQDLDKIDPDRAARIRTSTSTLADAMRQETESVLRQRRARGPQRARAAHRRLHVRRTSGWRKHYGIPNVVGERVSHASRCPTRRAAACSATAASSR